MNYEMDGEGKGCCSGEKPCTGYRLMSVLRARNS